MTMVVHFVAQSW